jgi:2',3'-cyclic-nucleotide 2'-phosphodiesterase (5'-nucleotidase family)
MTRAESNIVLFSITLCWASSYIFIKNLPQDLSSFAYMTMTAGLAGIILAIVSFKRLRELNWKLLLRSAIMNGGGIRTSLEVGEITRGDILSVLPFGNTVVLVEVKGAVLLAALENGVSQYPQEGGRFPQVAGITFSFDPAAKPGRRIVEATAGGRPLEQEKTYAVALNDFLAAGGDGYTMFAEAPVLKDYSSLDMIVADYIRENKILQVEAAGRIVICEPVVN